MKKQLLLLMMMLLPMVTRADDSGTCGENLTWTFVESTGTLTISGSGAMKDYFITSSYAPWYSYRSKIIAVIIKDGVTSIGNYAFEACSSLTSVTIGNSVTSIGDGAFGICSSLTSVTIPNCVTSIGNAAFGGCSSLTSVTIGNNVTSIGNEAFYGCSSLPSVAIGNSVTSIGNSAFEICTSLTSVTIGNSVTYIGNYAFKACSCLTSITIGNSVTSIGKCAFENCPRLNIIYCLNPTPPTCSGLSTFLSNNLRDEYDVYTYATLHVPMGSLEEYSSAYEWRYFNRIKEDMESGGNVYYANLIVQQGTTGYTRQAVKTAEKYTIYIGSLGDNKVNAVIFNGKDVTHEVFNGLYTTPEIKGESVLSISYETTPSAIQAISLKDVKVTGYNGDIQISNIDEPSDIFVYTADGKLVHNIKSAFGSVSVQAPSGQLYIIKVGKRTYKLAM